MENPVIQSNGKNKLTWFEKSQIEWIPSESIAPAPVKQKAPILTTERTRLPTSAVLTTVSLSISCCFCLSPVFATSDARFRSRRERFAISCRSFSSSMARSEPQRSIALRMTSWREKWRTVGADSSYGFPRSMKSNSHSSASETRNSRIASRWEMYAVARRFRSLRSFSIESVRCTVARALRDETANSSSPSPW